MPIIIEKQLIPPHQFGFRQKHSTIEQVHRIVRKINNKMEAKKYCSAAFIDISQAFDKVWRKGLLYKLRIKIPSHFYYILKSYLQTLFRQTKWGNYEATQNPLRPPTRKEYLDLSCTYCLLQTYLPPEESPQLYTRMILLSSQLTKTL